MCIRDRAIVIPVPAVKPVMSPCGAAATKLVTLIFLLASASASQSNT